MDTKSLALLEFPKVLERLSAFASFSASMELCRSLTPTADVELARRRQAITSEARRLLSGKTDVTVGGARDVRGPAGLAARAGVLDPQTLLDIKSTLISGRTLSRTLGRMEGQFPLLTETARGIEEIPGLIEAISQTIDERGEVLDSASPKLGEIRRELKVAHDRLMTRLDRIINDSRLAGVLQDTLITQRDGRYVVPVKTDFKGRVRGVVHDTSASGATVFIEPLATIELNNQLRELQLAERDEIRRILTQLSGFVGEQAEPIIATVEALAQLDLAFAKAKYADATRAQSPELVTFKPGGWPTVRLLGARHPLLDPTRVVAIDVDFGEETRALVITGPNTGGKTVSLKTVGLLTLMAQAGLHLPVASGSRLSVFRTVYADIGDEQSIEQSLSTFSAHITNIRRILDAMAAEQNGEGTLVIFDELGSGTDPGEGSALARAILSYLLDMGATSLIATHYPELKSYATSTAGVKNASVEFDPVTLAPTYRLSIGLPGRSNAFAIAARLGLNQTIIDDARTMVSQTDQTTEALLDELYKQRDAVAVDRERTEAARHAAEVKEHELERRLDAIEQERQKILDQARAEARRELEQVRADAERLRQRLALAEARAEATAADRVAEEAERIAEPISVPPAPIAPVRKPSGKTRSVRLGDTVKLKTLNQIGTVTALSGVEAEVKVGRLRVRAKLEELELRGSEETEDGRRKTAAESQAESAPTVTRHSPSVGMELDIRGKTVDEALPELEQYLDEAFLAELPFVRIIHGKGTGKLRQAVRDVLRANPQVKSLASGEESEGGDGVTLVRFNA